MKRFKITHFRILSMFVLFTGLTLTSCNDSSTSALSEKDMASSAQSIGVMMNNTEGSNVYFSNENVLTYDVIKVPADEQDQDGWRTTVCTPSGALAFDDPRWIREPGQTAYNVRPRLSGGLHPYEVWWSGIHSPANFGEADWIFATYNHLSIDVNPDGHNHNWSRYELPVDGNGTFELKLLADNCSWIYLDDKLVGYQDDDSNPELQTVDAIRYGVTLDGPATLTYITFAGGPGGNVGGKFRLETTTEDIPKFEDPNAPANQDPVADAGDDQTHEATGPTTSVTLDGSGSSDPDGDALTYSWSADGSEITTGDNPTVSLGLGTHVITLTVDDGNGGEDSDDVTVTVEDTTAPVLSFNQVTGILWPPNHKMVLVATGISALDRVDGATAVSVTVTSSEASNGKGDGNTDSDWEIVMNEDGTQDVYVRSERSGRGNGRTYTISMNTADLSDNSSSDSFEVQVAHNQGRGR